MPHPYGGVSVREKMIPVAEKHWFFDALPRKQIKLPGCGIIKLSITI